MEEAMKETKQGVVVATHKLTYRVKGKKGFPKTILNEIDFIAYPGQLMIIMGPSGSGKTTFLNAIAGRLCSRNGAKLSGDIMYNGSSKKNLVKSISNYVMQADNLLEFLTVRETLHFASKLRLKKMSPSERRQRVDQVAQELGLRECMDVIVGGQRKKGLSGGQKKRVSIAIEMLDNPKILFLDEPTSGLDSSLAYDTLYVLNALAKTGRTVISTVHQPRSQVFALFDQLMLLSSGNVVYLGPSAQAEDYFSSLGHHCPSHFNPADFYLDLISVDNGICDTDENCTQEIAVKLSPKSFGSNVEKREYGSFLDVIETNIPYKHSSSVIRGRVIISPEDINSFPSKFKLSTLGRSLEQAAEYEFQKVTVDTSGLRNLDIRSYAPSRKKCIDWWRAYSTLTQRSFLNSFRNPMNSVIQFIVHTSYALILGGIFFQMSRESPDDIQNILGFIFFIATQYAFANMDSLFSFPSERVLFNRETSNSLYPSSAFFAAKMTADCLFQHSALLVFSILTYWMAGLASTFKQFIIYIFIGVVCTWSATSYLYMVATGVAEVQAATVIAPIGGVVCMLLTGFFLKDDKIPSWISWLKYVNYLRYAFFALVQNEFPPGGVFGVGDNSLTHEEVLLRKAGIPLQPSIWLNIFICFALGVGHRLVAFAFMLLFHRRLGLEA